MESVQKYWEDRIFPKLNNNLIFEFDIPLGNPKDQFEISSKIFWKRSQYDIYTPAPPPLTFSSPCELNHTFDNGITIKGYLTIKQIESKDTLDPWGVFANFNYFESNSSNYIWHTEGFLVSFNPDFENSDDDDDDNIPVHPTDDEPKDSLITTDVYSDLFPYIYVTDWPTTIAADMIWNFFGYTPSAKSPPESTFIDKLVSLKSTNNRLAMQQEAILFIENKSVFTFAFVNDPNKFTDYIGRFQEFYETLIISKDLTSIIEVTCAFFKTNIDHFVTYLNSAEYIQNKERLWASYFALIIETGYAQKLLSSIIEILTLCNFLEITFKSLQNQELPISMIQHLPSLLTATIILYEGIFPLPPYSPSPPFDETAPILPYAIGNLQQVKYKLSNYEVGELANVISLMPGEKRKLIHRKMNRTVTEEVSKTATLDGTISSTDENNNDFNEELWNAIAETSETVDYPDPGLISTYGPPTNITIKGSYTKKNTTQTPDKKQVSSFAKKVLNKTAQRVSNKIHKIRSFTELKELEDTTVSIIDNRNNSSPEYGFYCWLNKIYKAKVINYDNRMLFNFQIPNPADGYIKQTNILNGIDLRKPKSLEENGIASYEDITKDNYLKIAQYYNLSDFSLYPEEVIVVSDIITTAQSKLIDLPELYFASSASIEYAFGTLQTNCVVHGFLGQQNFSIHQNETPTGIKTIPTLGNEQGKIGVGIVYDTILQMSPPSTQIDFQMGISIHCEPLPQTILSWRITLYQLALNAYQQEKDVYYAKTDSVGYKEKHKNPLEERLTVINALKKNVRKLLLEEALNINGLSLDLINKSTAVTFSFNQAEIIQYLDNALEWNEMSYTFFDQYNNSQNLFSVSSASPNFFSAFLNAKYVNVLIPVFPKLNQSFLYFLSTGSIWPIKDKLTPCYANTNMVTKTSSNQETIVFELKKVFGNANPVSKVIDSWNIKIPTSMQILQEKKQMNITPYEY